MLQIPADYRVGIVPASDTGAIEMAMWSLLGARGVDVLSWENFGESWVDDVDAASEAGRCRGICRRPTAGCPTSPQVDPDRDVGLCVERHDLGGAGARTATGSPPTARG